jgi:DNA mismatch endonuclease (patch repair protein)
MERFLRKKLRHGTFSDVSEQRSRIMSSIRGRRNKTTEQRLRMALIREGFRGWKLHDVCLPGCPDFVFREERLAIFVDGCFWHGCSRCGHVPKTRRSYWAAKIERNATRDRTNNRLLARSGFKVVRVWEHELTNVTRVLARISKALK